MTTTRILTDSSGNQWRILGGHLQVAIVGMTPGKLPRFRNLDAFDFGFDIDRERLSIIVELYYSTPPDFTVSP